MIEWAGVLYALAKDAYGYYKDGKEVFDAAKGAYETGKAVTEHFKINEGDAKLVDINWPQKSGFQEKANSEGYTIRWCRPNKVASREIDGYQVMYEIDKDAKIKRKLVLYDGLVLIGKKG